MAPEELTGLSAEELAGLMDVHVTTARRWLREQNAPGHVLRALRIVRRGELGAISKTWAGWRITPDGKLWSPEDDRKHFTPGAVRAGPLYEERAASYRSHLHHALEALKEAPGRRDRVEAIAALSNALVAVQAAAEALAQQLPPEEQRDLFQMLDSTRERAISSSQNARILRESLKENGRVNPAFLPERSRR